MGRARRGRAQAGAHGAWAAGRAAAGMVVSGRGGGLRQADGGGGRVNVRIVAASPPKTWRPGEIVVNPCAGWLGRDGRAVKVRPDVLRMSLALASRAGGYVGRETLTELLWGERADAGRTTPSPRSITSGTSCAPR